MNPVTIDTEYELHQQGFPVENDPSLPSHNAALHQEVADREAAEEMQGEHNCYGGDFDPFHMDVKGLKRFIESQGLTHHDCVEKLDLQQRAKEARRQPSAKMCDEDSSKTALFQHIQHLLDPQLSPEFLSSLRTQGGKTQASEAKIISKIRETLKEHCINFSEAGSQQSCDFRDVGNIGLDIEVKKTDSGIIKFNDTCPSSEIFYIIAFTGKEFKRKPDLPARVIYCNGYEFIRDSPWVHEYKREIDRLKDLFGRGDGAAKLSGMMKAYPRPNFSANIEHMLKST